MPQVYSEPLCRRHYASWIGDAMVMRVGLFLIAIAVSLVVAFATGGFWIKLKPTVAQPTVHYTYDALLLFEGNQAGEERIWSTSQTVNTQFANKYIAASVQSGEEDYNFDGKPDVIEFNAQVQGGAPVYGVKALLQLRYQFKGTVRLKMYSLAYLSYSSPAPGGALYTDGELVLQQRSPITDRKYNGLYDSPMLSSNSPSFVQAVEGATELQFESIIKSYLDRNYTTAYQNNFPVWKPGPGNSFTLNMRIRIPPNQVVWIRPQVIEMLKFGWIQFLATYVVLWWLFSWLQFFAFRYRLVDSRVISDVQPKAQRF